MLRPFVAVALTAALLALPTASGATQDEVPLPLDPVDRSLDAAPGDGVDGLTGGHGTADLAVYPSYAGPESFHFWHGRVASDVELGRGEAWSYRMGLTVQTVADTRNSIAFRPTRLYYEAHATFEHRLGSGVGWVGYRHRCSHGVDAAVPGRILIRSGPELGYAAEREVGAVRVAGRGFALLTLIGQYGDRYKPRALSGVSGVATWRHGRVSVFVGGGIGVALVGDEGPFAYGPWHAWGELHLEPLPTAAVGFGVHGDGATFRLVAHGQRLLDSGFGEHEDPTWVVSVGPSLGW